jgi:hypothetical protein
MRTLIVSVTLQTFPPISHNSMDHGDIQAADVKRGEDGNKEVGDVTG